VDAAASSSKKNFGQVDWIWAKFWQNQDEIWAKLRQDLGKSD